MYALTRVSSWDRAALLNRASFAIVAHLDPVIVALLLEVVAPLRGKDRPVHSS